MDVPSCHRNDSKQTKDVFSVSAMTMKNDIVNAVWTAAVPQSHGMIETFVSLFPLMAT